jgi:arylsulfatase A
MLSTMDLFPTLLGAAGLPLPTGRELDGRDLLAVLAHDAPSPHDELCFYYSDAAIGIPAQAAVRRGPWKLLRVAEETQLFHLPDDPAETRDRVDDYPGVAAGLFDRLHRWERSFELLA